MSTAKFSLRRDYEQFDKTPSCCHLNLEHHYKMADATCSILLWESCKRKDLSLYILLDKCSRKLKKNGKC